MKNNISADLEFFVLVARHRSLSAAARGLDITPPAATKRLAQLESRLGIRLVNRTTRSISLTSEGETFLAHATRILEQIGEMEQAVTSGRATPRGLLRVNATLGFGRTTIAPLVSEFSREYPDVEVQVEVTDRPIDLVESGFDLAIRFGTLPDRRLSARRIMSNRRYLCASPDYLKQHGTPKTLADLARHRCIIHRQNDDTYGIWRFVSRNHSEAIKVHGVLSSNDGDIVLGWALDGHGIAIRSEWDLAKYIESGRLKIVLPKFGLPSADLFAYYPGQRNLPVRTRAFIDFLLARFRKPFKPIGPDPDD
ncbi:LysR family transcriptional regulator [Noviherbaspirillum galbum]|uniref:LysR family transcriptional regulator n=1 Tax=Noviherbaspirillum galbum TaxID=2709383 RepID=A0A6B3SVM6_9BURK|nr:LysR family transcriptional regulator [Noviherbaspirillum galbum]NEX62956.1 LysR family transcriptional regulator [Noviherbaspirillum galbum]